MPSPGTSTRCAREAQHTPYEHMFARPPDANQGPVPPVAPCEKSDRPLSRIMRKRGQAPELQDAIKGTDPFVASDKGNLPDNNSCRWSADDETDVDVKNDPA